MSSQTNNQAGSTTTENAAYDTKAYKALLSHPNLKVCPRFEGHKNAGSAFDGWTDNKTTCTEEKADGTTCGAVLAKGEVDNKDD
ncbi:hypothetical protein MMC30_008069 [Trapelia coarctata]|nr:hypothetical protein [Trapelia coarctata]